MAAEDSRSGTTRPGGFLDPFRTLVTTFLTVLQTRLELFFTELEEEQERLKEVLLLAVISLFCLILGVLLLTLFIVAVFWDTHRFYILGGFTIFYLGLGLILGLIMRKKALSRPKLFSATMSELAKDLKQLKS